MIDQRWAVIAHLDIGSALEGEATCRLVLVDLEAGRHAGQLCVAAREWEKRTDVFSIVTDDLAVTVPVTSVEQIAAPSPSPIGEVEQRAEVATAAASADIAPPKPSPAGPAASASQPHGDYDQPVPAGESVAPEGSTENGRRAGVTPMAESPVESPPHRDQADTLPTPPAERRAALLARYQALNVDQQRAFLALKAAKDDLDAVEKALDEVDPFAHEQSSPPLPPRRPVAKVAHRFTPDEGGQADSQAIAALRRSYEALDDHAKAWVGALVTQGKTAGVPWNTNAAHTVRRFELGLAVVRLVDVFHAGDALTDILRGLLEEATQREEVGQEALPLGAAIGSLDADEAVRFAALVDDYLALGASA